MLELSVTTGEISEENQGENVAAVEMELGQVTSDTAQQWGLGTAGGPCPQSEKAVLILL